MTTVILIIVSFIGGIITGKWIIPFFTKAENTIKSDISKVETTAKNDISNVKKKI